MSFTSFGEALGYFRELRGISQHRLGLLAQVSPSNINRMESGARGVPEPRTLLAIAEALHLSTAERRDLIKVALAETVKEKTEQYAVYLYLFLADEQEMRSRARELASDASGNRPIRDFLVSRGTTIDLATVRDLFLNIADNPEYVDQRRMLAPFLIEQLMIDLQRGEVGLRLGGIASGLLGEDVEVADEESSPLAQNSPSPSGQ